MHEVKEPARELRHRDTLYLDSLRDFYKKRQVIPALSVLMDLWGLASKSSARNVVNRLRAAGYLEEDCERLHPTSRFFERPLPERTARALSGENVLGAAISIDDFLITRPSATTLIKVEDDRMINACICPGDIVVLQRTANANNSDIVLAALADGYGLAYLLKDGSGWVLRAANPRYPDDHPARQPDIIGRVVGLIRKYA